MLGPWGSGLALCMEASLQDMLVARRRALHLMKEGSSSFWSTLRSRIYQITVGEDMLGTSALAGARGLSLTGQIQIHSCTLQDLEPSLWPGREDMPCLPAWQSPAFWSPALRWTSRLAPDLGLMKEFLEVWHWLPLGLCPSHWSFL